MHALQAAIVFILHFVLFDMSIKVILAETMICQTHRHHRKSAHFGRPVSRLTASKIF